MKNRILLPMTALAVALILSPAHSSQSQKAADAKTTQAAKKEKDLPFEEIDFKKVKDGTVVAVVNGKKISVNEVFQVMSSLPPQLRQIPMELLFMATRDQLIDMNLLKAEADKQKKQLERLPEVQEAIEKAVEQIILQAHMNELVESKITTRKVSARYQELKEKFPKGTSEVKIRLILLKNEKEAKSVLKQLQEGADFLKMAREKSIDDVTAKKDGLIDKYFNILAKNEWLPGFDQLFKKDNKGKYVIKTSGLVQEPIKTPAGYAIYKIDDRKPFLFPKMKELRKLLTEQLKKELIEEHTRKLEAKSKVTRLHPNSGKPMNALADELKKLQDKLAAKAKAKKAQATAKN
ncbi:MAG: peptidylprolyl isomerase [Pseudomonadota bacterium]